MERLPTWLLFESSRSITDSCSWLKKSTRSIGSVAPRKSDDPVSLSKALKVREDEILSFIEGSWKVSFQVALLPAPSFTSVFRVLPPNSKVMYGSYFPKRSASFRKVADFITTFSIDLLSQIVGGAT